MNYQEFRLGQIVELILLMEGKGEALEELVEVIETQGEVEADGQDVMAEVEDLGTLRPQQQTSLKQV